MARRRYPLPVAISLLGLLAGCATPQIPPDVDTSGMPSTEVALQRSLDQTDAAMGKLGAANRAEAVRMATDNGWLS